MPFPSPASCHRRLPLLYRLLFGHVAEWLRNGLQNRVLRFNSGRGLHFLEISEMFLASFCKERRAESPLAFRISITYWLPLTIC